MRRAIIEAATGDDLKLEDVELSYPEVAFGDYSTNIALKIARDLKMNPRELAESIAAKVNTSLPELLEGVSVAGPGFINFTLTDRALMTEIDAKPATPLAGQVVVAEFSDPNPFKLLHAGHLYTSIVGDAISRLLEISGAAVHRVTYGGDVGLHVGRSMWAMLQDLDGEHPERLQDIPEAKRSEWMSQAYVKGTAAYEDSETAKREIIELNKKIYEIQGTADHDSPLAQIYWTTRQWSYEAFDKFYARLGISFEKFYPESEATPIGMAVVKEQLKKGIFEQSDGAIVFRGEKYGLHTRVFINSQGLPTYEAKEIGLAELKKRDYSYDRSVIITGNEQEQYMAVVYKALEQFAPELTNGTTHMTHGMVRLSGGKKMSSRHGNILRAEDILDASLDAAKKVSDNNDERVVLAAVKYSFLKQRMGSDLVYEPEESVNVLGNSGPYLQYAHARARSILNKSKQSAVMPESLTADERLLALKLSRYADTVTQAANELSPHIVCTYLYETAQAFNRFYEANRVIGDERESERIALVRIYADMLKMGLSLLGIEAPERL